MINGVKNTGKHTAHNTKENRNTGKHTHNHTTTSAKLARLLVVSAFDNRYKRNKVFHRNFASITSHTNISTQTTITVVTIPRHSHNTNTSNPRNNQPRSRTNRKTLHRPPKRQNTTRRRPRVSLSTTPQLRQNNQTSFAIDRKVFTVVLQQIVRTKPVFLR
ncbi:unnamed protein product [Brassica oleracea]